MTSTLLAVIASIIQITAFGIYNKQTLDGHARPNTASWGIWAFGTVINFTSYHSMSGDWVKALLPTVSSFACILTFVICCFIGKARRLDKFDISALVLGIVASLAWWQYNSATYANLILQLCIIIGFIPTYRGLRRNPGNEKPLCWWMWTSAYVITGVVVILRWQGQYQDLVYPVNCFFLHAGIAVMANREPAAKVL